ncbi:lambda-crystallin homolog [Artibeus jamaicensis]|uniref:lambda-crystallin homolog n=1 Tax=Artibeus jamaicensis TaxID=9417 RepID=UPI00235B0CDA|nr:lambda-crystallin homolog [Artibeus jamaicensis]
MGEGHGPPRRNPAQSGARVPSLQHVPAVLPGQPGASMATSAAGQVLIVGSGLIGRSWAMLFASGGFRVKLYDIERQQVTNALENIRKDMKLLEQSGSLKGSLSAEQQLSLISGCSNIQEAAEGAMHIQVS